MEERDKNQLDFDVRDFAYMLTSLKAHLPVSDYLEACDPQPNNKWWESQREHLIHYFSNRVNLDNADLSSKRAYERLKCSEAIVWLAEALNVLDHDELLVIARKALRIPRRRTTKSNSRYGFVLQQIPWELIAVRAKEMEELHGKVRDSSYLKNLAAEFPKSQAESHHQSTRTDTE